MEEIARIEVLGADGRVETIEGTTVHPIWSLDRHDWIPLGELAEGEQLLGSTGPAIILTHAILHRSLPVYNIQVHGEHVYEVGQLAVLVHNSEPCLVRFGQAAETVAQLADDAARAAANGFPHGVSTKLVKRLSGSDKLHRSALKKDVESLFKVEQTGRNPNHFTVHLPQPITEEVAKLFNSVFVFRN